MPKGRPAKPTTRHKADGTYQPVRHANRLEVAPAKNLPEPPADFDERHAAKWLELTSNMQEMGTLATQDLDSIRAYVVFFFRFEDANAVLNKQGTIIETSTGAKVNPAWRIMVESQKELRTLWAAFGLTPADRARIKIEKPKPTTSILDFMSVTKKAQ